MILNYIHHKNEPHNSMEQLNTPTLEPENFTMKSTNTTGYNNRIRWNDQLCSIPHESYESYEKLNV